MKTLSKNSEDKSVINNKGKPHRIKKTRIFTY